MGVPDRPGAWPMTPPSAARDRLRRQKLTAPKHEEPSRTFDAAKWLLPNSTTAAPTRETFTACHLALSPNARQTHTRGYARAVHGNQRHGAGKPFHLVAGNRVQRRNSRLTWATTGFPADSL